MGGWKLKGFVHIADGQQNILAHFVAHRFVSYTMMSQREFVQSAHLERDDYFLGFVTLTFFTKTNGQIIGVDTSQL